MLNHLKPHPDHHRPARTEAGRERLPIEHRPIKRRSERPERLLIERDPAEVSDF